MLLSKNPQFLLHTDRVTRIEPLECYAMGSIRLTRSVYDYETRSKLGTHEYLILTEFRNHWVKMVDFLIKEYAL